jgi:ADP-ribose pyrophosphatase YjhB (NUDIX family)
VKPIRNSAKAIIIQDDRLLTIKKQDDEGFYYILPGGGQHPGESLTIALARECREELSIDVSVADMVCIREYIGKNHEFAESDGDGHSIEFMFACSLPDGAVVANGEEPDESQVGFEWIPLYELETCRFYPRALSRILPDECRKPHPLYLGDVN